MNDTNFVLDLERKFFVFFSSNFRDNLFGKPLDLKLLFFFCSETQREKREHELN